MSLFDAVSPYVNKAHQSFERCRVNYNAMPTERKAATWIIAGVATLAVAAAIMVFAAFVSNHAFAYGVIAGLGTGLAILFYLTYIHDEESRKNDPLSKAKDSILTKFNYLKNVKF